MTLDWPIYNCNVFHFKICTELQPVMTSRYVTTWEETTMVDREQSRVGHRLQTNRCRVRLLFWANDLGHMLQLKSLSPMWQHMCVLTWCLNVRLVASGVRTLVWAHICMNAVMDHHVVPVVAPVLPASNEASCIQGSPFLIVKRQ